MDQELLTANGVQVTRKTGRRRRPLHGVELFCPFAQVAHFWPYPCASYGDHKWAIYMELARPFLALCWVWIRAQKGTYKRLSFRWSQKTGAWAHEKNNSLQLAISVFRVFTSNKMESPVQQRDKLGSAPAKRVPETLAFRYLPRRPVRVIFIHRVKLKLCVSSNETYEKVLF